MSWLQSAQAGMVCAVTGLEEHAVRGRGSARRQTRISPLLEPVLTYRLELPEGCDVHAMLINLRQPGGGGAGASYRVGRGGAGNPYPAYGRSADRSAAAPDKGAVRRPCRIQRGQDHIQRDDRRNTVEGVGHFEPLRHYAEVHLLLEPGERGSGLQFSSECSEDVLDRNWQRLILTHLDEKEHRGVLTGSALTDVRITLISGRAHQKHTEGGDFRQATYRAVRQGLMKARSVLLEPYYEFRMELPMENVGRAMT